LPLQDIVLLEISIVGVRHPFPPPPPLQSLPYCNTIARPLRKKRLLPDPPLASHIPYNVGRDYPVKVKRSPIRCTRRPSPVPRVNPLQGRLAPLERLLSLYKIFFPCEAVVHESTNRPFVHSPRPPPLPTLVQCYCTIIGQYTTSPPNSRLYTTLYAIQYW